MPDNRTFIVLYLILTTSKHYNKVIMFSDLYCKQQQQTVMEPTVAVNYIDSNNTQCSNAKQHAYL